MQIALLGGTGDIGEGLALRFGRDTEHDLIIGSRSPEKAKNVASEYERRLLDHGLERTIKGDENGVAATHSDVLILSVPPYHIGETLESLTGLRENQILVTPAVGMRGDDDGLHYHPPDVGSVTELVADRSPAHVPVVGAFHNLSAGRLSDLNATLDADTLVLADDPEAKSTVMNLANEIDGLRALDVGPLANAPEIESVTPLVINIARYNKGLDDVGVTFH